MSIVITAGQRGDCPQFEPVLKKVRLARSGSGRPRTRPYASALPQPSLEEAVYEA